MLQIHFLREVRKRAKEGTERGGGKWEMGEGKAGTGREERVREGLSKGERETESSLLGTARLYITTTQPEPAPALPQAGDEGEREDKSVRVPHPGQKGC